MTGVYTASWGVALAEQQARRADPEVVPVRISVGCPRAAQDAPVISALAPFGLFGKDLPPDEFAAGYRARLERYGVEAIRGRIERVARQHPGRPLLLCCFEKDPSDCHRGLLSEWWHAQTGETIPEWEPGSGQPEPVSGRPDTDQLSLTDPEENR